MTTVDPRIGTTLKAKWRVEGVLGVGGMATVYSATHRNGKRVAVKMLHPELSRDLGMRERFIREGYVANKVGRGAVIVDDDDVTDDGAAFLVMELLEGETLDARRERAGGRLHPNDVVVAMDQVLGALAVAHAQGIVHRDLKPDNMFMTQEGVVKILDFGIARLREGGSSVGATATGMAMGTPAFLPPEQARGAWKEVDGRTDLWAVGATMFTLLTGRYVHQAENLNLLLLAAMTQPAPPLRSVAPEVPDEIAAVVDRALQTAQAARWADATAMREALRRACPAVASRLPAIVTTPPALAPGTGPRGTIPISSPALTPAATPAARPSATPAAAATPPAIGTLVVSAPSIAHDGPPRPSLPDTGGTFRSGSSAQTVPPNTRSGVWTGAAVAGVLLLVGGGGGAMWLNAQSRAPAPASQAATAEAIAPAAPSGQPPVSTASPSPQPTVQAAPPPAEPARSAKPAVSASPAALAPRTPPGVPTPAAAPRSLVPSTSGLSACTKDTDCKGNRVCENGECVWPR